MTLSYRAAIANTQFTSWTGRCSGADRRSGELLIGGDGLSRATEPPELTAEQL